ncbi:hypothetical protein EAF04_001851 [Stromatinia cepivora]|nr:hypothetical protein EAF04_001851 [Stromatinia cepivora]
MPEYVFKRVCFQTQDPIFLQAGQEVDFTYACIQNLLALNNGEPIMQPPVMGNWFRRRKTLRYHSLNTSYDGPSTNMNWLFEPKHTMTLGERCIWEVRDSNTNSIMVHYITEVNLIAKDDRAEGYSFLTNKLSHHFQRCNDVVQQRKETLHSLGYDLSAIEMVQDTENFALLRLWFLKWWMGDDVGNIMNEREYVVESILQLPTHEYTTPYIVINFLRQRENLNKYNNLIWELQTVILTWGLDWTLLQSHGIGKMTRMMSNWRGKPEGYYGESNSVANGEHAMQYLLIS